MVELIVVMILVGIMSAVFLPKMSTAIGQQDRAWHDSVQSALRFAQKTAVSRRRLTCAIVEAQRVRISTDKVYQSYACDLAIRGPEQRQDADGFFPFVFTSRGRTTWTGTLFFQPDGRVTTDAIGTVVASTDITVQNGDTIHVFGETGYVE
ncbi:MAG: hypothetical protein RI907_3182 [Pseudomonadota bacterium]